MRKLIGITCGRNNNGRLEIRSEYINAILRNNSIPVALPPLKNKKIIAEIAERLDGFVISGGGDISPEFLKIKPLNKYRLRELDPTRDIFELCLVKTAIKLGRPILGICKGAQIINTAFGGTLHLDIPQNLRSLKTKINHSKGSHMIRIKNGSMLHKIFNKKELEVNTSHHQSVNKTGTGMKATAFSGDGAIESIEGTGNNFIIGVQFHPERMIQTSPLINKLFKEFIKAC